MPRKALFSKEEIIEKALFIMRTKGPDALTARELGAALGCSARPIFTLFRSMDEVCEEVDRAAKRVFEDYVADVTDYEPAFKEFGMRLVRFAKEENQLFRYLFFRNNNSTGQLYAVAQACLKDISWEYGLTSKQLHVLYDQMWTFTCGLAALSANNQDSYTDKVVGRMLSLQYVAILSEIKYVHKVVNIKPRKKRKGVSLTLNVEPHNIE